jgi:hypothetical protein
MIGLVELALLVGVVAVMYGRTGVFKSRQFQAIWPWISPQRRGGVRPGAASGRPGGTSQTVVKRKSRLPSFEGNKLYWFLTILAATAISTWIVTRMIITSGGPASSH